MKIGLGKDSHRFLNDQELAHDESPCSLIIGGVSFEDARPFKAHSDGDVLYHAVYNSISSALGFGSIGKTFPDTSDSERGRNSAEYLRYCAKMLSEQGFVIASLSIVVECAVPKIDPAAVSIRENLSSLLPVSARDIGITATTGEGLTPWGKGEGVEVLSAVLLKEGSRGD